MCASASDDGYKDKDICSKADYRFYLYILKVLPTLVLKHWPIKQHGQSRPYPAQLINNKHPLHDGPRYQMARVNCRIQQVLFSVRAFAA